MAKLIVIAIILPIVNAGYNKNYYMPGTNCNTIRIREVDGAVIRSSPNRLWSNSACLMKFESDDSLFTTKKLMINIEELNIENCEVSLKIYYHRSSEGHTPDHTFTCRSSKPQLIFPGKYATLRLDTRTDKGYSFKIIITSYKQSTFCSEYSCANKKCIEDKLRCDGINHCGDNSDETRCSGRHRVHRFGMGSTLASAFSTLVVVLICVAVCIFCVRRRRRSSQGQVLQQQLTVHTGIEPGPPPPSMQGPPGTAPYQQYEPGPPPPGMQGPPGTAPYQPVPQGYQMPGYNPGTYPPPPGPMPFQQPPPYGAVPQQPYNPAPMGPVPAYPPPPDGSAMYPPPIPMGPPPPGQYPPVQ